MLPKQGEHNERFYQLLEEVKAKVDRLKTDAERLQKENTRLESELQEYRNKQREDAFASLNETERIAIKHQIKGLITKIDEHLEDQA